MINIGLITAKQAKLRPNEWAVYDQSSKKRITFLELDEQVKKIANGLIDLGLEKGDRVSILSQNTIEFLGTRGNSWTYFEAPTRLALTR